jgi:hypothetical protein
VGALRVEGMKNRAISLGAQGFLDSNYFNGASYHNDSNLWLAEYEDNAKQSRCLLGLACLCHSAARDGARATEINFVSP